MAALDASSPVDEAGKQPPWLFLYSLNAVWFAALGCLLPFAPVYFERKGMNKANIGYVLAIPPMLGIVACLVAAYIGDRYRLHRVLLHITGVVSSLVIAAYLLTTNLLWSYAIITVFALTYSPFAVLVTSVVLELLGSKREQFGRTRVSAALAWGLSAAALGYLVDHLGVDTIIFGYCGFSLLAVGMLAVYLPPKSYEPALLDSEDCQGSYGSVPRPTEPASPHTPVSPPLSPSVQAIGSHTKANAHGHGAVQGSICSLFGSWRVASFMAVAVLFGAGLSVVQTYLFLYLLSLGASHTLLGVTIIFTILVELPVFHYSKLLLDTIGIRGMIVVAHLAYITRVLIYPELRRPWLVCPVELLHGLTYALIYPAGVEYCNQLAHVYAPDMEATAQSLFSGFFGGIGQGAGALLGGVVYHTYGSTVLFHGMAVVSGGSLILFLVTYKDVRDH